MLSFCTLKHVRTWDSFQEMVVAIICTSFPTMFWCYLASLSLSFVLLEVWSSAVSFPIIMFNVHHCCALSPTKYVNDGSWALLLLYVYSLVRTVTRTPVDQVQLLQEKIWTQSTVSNMPGTI